MFPLARYKSKLTLLPPETVYCYLYHNLVDNATLSGGLCLCYLRFAFNLLLDYLTECYGLIDICGIGYGWLKGRSHVLFRNVKWCSKSAAISEPISNSRDPRLTTADNGWPAYRAGVLTGAISYRAGAAGAGAGHVWPCPRPWRPTIHDLKVYESELYNTVQYNSKHHTDYDQDDRMRLKQYRLYGQDDIMRPKQYRLYGQDDIMRTKQYRLYGQDGVLDNTDYDQDDRMRPKQYRLYGQDDIMRPKQYRLCGQDDIMRPKQYDPTVKTIECVLNNMYFAVKTIKCFLNNTDSVVKTIECVRPPIYCPTTMTQYSRSTDCKLAFTTGLPLRVEIHKVGVRAGPYPAEPVIALLYVPTRTLHIDNILILCNIL
ncbi:hypothetical protein J6590_056879 [Homalodisca vitripennis]|nr:hypothetical protein J6590_056879 [Homalodisca vitripennis]